MTVSPERPPAYPLQPQQDPYHKLLEVHLNTVLSCQTTVNAAHGCWDTLFRVDDQAGHNRFQVPAAISTFSAFVTHADSKKYLVPFLSLVATILGTHTMDEELLEFLYSCCNELEKSPEAGYPASAFYQYLLAFSIDDEAMIVHHGNRLQDAVSFMTHLYGQSNVSVVAGRNFLMWHRMYTDTFATSMLKSELKDCIVLAQKTHGRDHLLVVNSLALLGRLLQERGRYSQAAEAFTDAIGRLEGCPKLLQAYKLELYQRLATVQYTVGLAGRSALCLLDVFNGRIQILGHDHSYTSGALQQLRNQLNESEKSDSTLGRDDS
ncbi:uncharacterized protein PV06_11639 [Exophiala oligosperma]|uniref:MalT-like TPR region domain-containing protein n=1 Tax=Exophiala oligosperma TaxID=215243 RepID=A0A0D2DK33_9EURO|nr:uncharacterized protein PV06_11639 [Exophiala oligosperma]KIW36059.1 hypothetical protein PV06_11639 [Exophiala oligosperma]